MIIEEKKIEYKYGDVIKIKPLFDVHLGNNYCDKQACKKYLADSDENTYFIGGGDLLDSIVVTDPRYAKHADGTLGDIIDDQVDMAVEILEPYKDRIIGIGKGNHEEQIVKRCGTDPIRTICQRLGVTHLGLSGLIRLVFTENGSRGRTVIVRWHHGWGGGARTLGASITRYSKDMMYWDADLYLYGHDHQRKMDRIERMGLSGKKLIAKPKVLVVCGTFLKTFSESTDTSYSELKGYPPTSIGGVNINIKPVDRWVNIWVDV